MLATLNGSLECVRLLLDSDPELKTTEPSLLHCAAKEGNDDIVKLLLERGFDRDVKNSEGKTAWDLAFENGHGRRMTMLVGFYIEVSRKINFYLVLGTINK
jgi:ankyrin repeat protein